LRYFNVPGSDENVFSATDISAYFCIPQNPYKVTKENRNPTKNYHIANLSVISISTHRDKFPVTSLGNVGIKGFTRGHRVIGGTMVFQTFDRHAFYNALVELESQMTGQTVNQVIAAESTMLADEMPPFDIIISMVNEDGVISYMSVLGVILQDEGRAISVDNINLSETYSYMAMAYIPMQPYASKIEQQPNYNSNTVLTPNTATPIAAGMAGASLAGLGATSVAGLSMGMPGLMLPGLAGLTFVSSQ
jgi:hypothetical protein